LKLGGLSNLDRRLDRAEAQPEDCRTPFVNRAIANPSIANLHSPIFTVI